MLYTLNTGDISDGTVTLRLYYRQSSSTNRSLSAVSVLPFQVYAKNLGPADPN